MLNLQTRMMDIVAASFGTDPKTGVTADLLRDAVINWRMLPYPRSEVPDFVGVGAHTDFGFTTLLATNGTPGLEVYSNGQWHPVEPEARAFIVNIGDTLSRVSGGAQKSSLHRVNNNGLNPRYYVPCFVEWNLGFVVKPLDADPNSTEKYPTVEELVYLTQKETVKDA